MKVLILADGKGTRWGNWNNTPKQLLKVHGETILDRMIRLCIENGIKKEDIVIIGDFKNKNAVNDTFKDCEDKRHLFLEIAKRYKEPFILLNGDCYYTEAIIKDCIEREAPDGWLHWCCPHKNRYTRKPWGEGYIHKVVDVNWWISKLEEYNRLVDTGAITPKGDWAMNRWIYGAKDINKHYADKEHLSKYDVYWHDQTDDFDFSGGNTWGTGYGNDYERFLHFTGYRGE